MASLSHRLSHSHWCRCPFVSILFLSFSTQLSFSFPALHSALCTCTTSHTFFFLLSRDQIRWIFDLRFIVYVLALVRFALFSLSSSSPPLSHSSGHPAPSFVDLHHNHSASLSTPCYISRLASLAFIDTVGRNCNSRCSRNSPFSSPVFS